MQFTLPDLDLEGFLGDVEDEPVASTSRGPLLPEFDIDEDDRLLGPSAPPSAAPWRKPGGAGGISGLGGKLSGLVSSDSGMFLSARNATSRLVGGPQREVLHLPSITPPAGASPGAAMALQPTRVTRPQREWKVAKRVMCAVAFKKGGENRRRLEDEILSSADESGGESPTRREPDWRHLAVERSAAAAAAAAGGPGPGNGGLRTSLSHGALAGHNANGGGTGAGGGTNRGNGGKVPARSGSVTARSVFSAEEEDLLDSLAEL
ncbi:hypothetical protein CHLRE_06g297950v5 [Chlamydomonas reinhardtii]|uniref:Uncharacterized protein n=1 Tax=Chlamydomonas reinhardtii TaxID=3055 RepID=A8IP61_CHLRE|nr:uncharacterized protein CHLRE_06g297950v5 [Chlamydomonas reinhardtii]XP_042924249.1 uncharacterized protein CHLRE_06g297950v5 [Chlamydomonas reinhardtii]PNW82875.1 hypothetical protein CHLRE_06g297950v5 [Chlamydomonas reinhardtii]PNW82876.1 hypothetical protein CHLRE_06g297950v5 [Chlamydomonas reinhardtii]|eukprot:XP_001691303.1 predicted protein [Chlamydomonas reinhardtii]